MARLGLVLALVWGCKEEAVPDLARILDPLAGSRAPTPDTAEQLERDFAAFSDFAARHNARLGVIGPSSFAE